MQIRTEEPWLAGDHVWTPKEVKFFGTDLRLLYYSEIFDVDAVYVTFNDTPSLLRPD